MSPRLAAAIKELDAAIEDEVRARIEEKPAKRDELSRARARDALKKRGLLRTSTRKR